MAEDSRLSLWTPPSVLLAIAVTSFAGYNATVPAMANLIVFAYAASLALGASLVYPWMRSLGASPSRSALGSLVVPVVWLLKECYSFSAAFSPAETLYYALNPLSLAVFSLSAVQMAGCELLLRWFRGRRGEVDSIRTARPLVIIALGLAFILWASGNDGRSAFYPFIRVYVFLFG